MNLYFSLYKGIYRKLKITKVLTLIDPRTNAVDVRPFHHKGITFLSHWQIQVSSPAHVHLYVPKFFFIS